jgi:hypothetical protein
MLVSSLDHVLNLTDLQWILVILQQPAPAMTKDTPDDQTSSHEEIRECMHSQIAKNQLQPLIQHSKWRLAFTCTSGLTKLLWESNVLPALQLIISSLQIPFHLQALCLLAPTCSEEM